MSSIMGLVFFIAFIAIFVYAFKWIKNRRNRTLKKRYRKNLLISVLVMVIAAGIGGATTDKSNESSTKSSDTAKSAKIVKKKQYVGKDKYNIAKKENVALIAKEKKLSQQNDKLDDQKEKIESDEAAAAEQAKEQQAAAQKQQEAAQKEQAKQAAAAQKQQQKQQEQAQSQPSQQSSGQTRGDMNTSDSGKIVGNINSHIYHVPGQSGYNMNSSNAVYFNSEQEAINAGYRRAKR